MNTLTLPEDGALHVIPSTETKRHIKSPSCWCGPSEEEPGIWLHGPTPRNPKEAAKVALNIKSG
jgi:hypothetical protein